MILALYTPKNCIVRVVESYDLGGGRKRFLVQAIEGEPFEANSHGGPMMTSSALVSREYLAEIRQAPVPTIHRLRPTPSYTAPAVRPELTYTRLAEDLAPYAGLFPSGRRGRQGKSLGGINND